MSQNQPAKQAKNSAHPNLNVGRKPGAVNKSTAQARAAIALFCETNIPNMQKWLEKIAKKDGELAAFKCTLELMEYYVPKLARTEVAGDPDAPVVHKVISWK